MLSTMFKYDVDNEIIIKTLQSHVIISHKYLPKETCTV